MEAGLIDFGFESNDDDDDDYIAKRRHGLPAAIEGGPSHTTAADDNRVYDFETLQALDDEHGFSSREHESLSNIFPLFNRQQLALCFRHQSRKERHLWMVQTSAAF
jgi:hypothetical protein